MKPMKKELLAAVAAAALAATAGGAGAQVKMDTQTGAQGGATTQAPGQQGQKPGTQVQGQGGADARKQTGPGGVQTQTQGGAKSGVQSGQPGQDGMRTQTQGGAKSGVQSGQDGTRTQGGAKSGTQTGQDGAKSGTQTGQGGSDARQPGQAQQDQDRRDGQPGATDKPAQLSSEQRTKISSTIRGSDVNLKRVERTNINFNINVGAVVPRTVGLVPLPAPIVAVVPAYRGYLYIVVEDDLLIIHPRTYEIVAVIPA